MATRKINGRESRLAPRFDSAVILSSARQVAAAATTISRVSDDVFEGAEAQAGTLDRATGVLNEMAASLKETASQATSVTVSAEELASAVAETAASIEQVTSNTASLSEAITRTAGSVQQSAASIQHVTATVQEMAAAALC
jgi:methyl-accepting chemotaxis protein